MKKTCTKCGKNKDLEEYYRNANHKDGRQPECKSCRIAVQKEYAKSDKGKAVNAKHMKSAKGKATQSKYMKTDKGKATAARRNNNSRYWKSKTLNDLHAKEFNYIIYDCQDNKCACCGRTFNKNLKPTRDHIYPVSKGGDFTVHTVQALCQSCNSKKGIEHIDYRTDYHKNALFNMDISGLSRIPIHTCRREADYVRVCSMPF